MGKNRRKHGKQGKQKQNLQNSTLQAKYSEDCLNRRMTLLETFGFGYWRLAAHNAVIGKERRPIANERYGKHG